jgi:hypothetical protein
MLANTYISVCAADSSPSSKEGGGASGIIKIFKRGDESVPDK